MAFEAAYRAGGEWLEALMTYLADTREMVRQYLAEYLPEIRLILSQGTLPVVAGLSQVGHE